MGDHETRGKTGLSEGGFHFLPCFQPLSIAPGRSCEQALVTKRLTNGTWTILLMTLRAPQCHQQRRHGLGRNPSTEADLRRMDSCGKWATTKPAEKQGFPKAAFTFCRVFSPFRLPQAGLASKPLLPNDLRTAPGPFC